MSHFLLTWEFGGRSGHVGRLAPLAEALVDRGHSVTIAAREPSVVAPRVNLDRVRVVPTPCKLDLRLQHPVPFTHTQTLGNFGFEDADCLASLVAAWLGLFREIGPDRVVGDYSPVALLAARVAALPAIAYGTGFEVPPDIEPLPNLRPEIECDNSVLIAQERQTLSCVNGVLGRHGRPAIPRLAALYHAEAPVLLTYRELDPYAAVRGPAEYAGVTTASWVKTPTWPPGRNPRIFAYLINHSFSVAILNALAASGCSTLVVPDAGLASATIHIGVESLAIENEQVDMPTVAQASDLAVTYGGHGVTAAMLRSGTPLMITPHTLEQRLHADRAAAEGLAVVCPIGDGPRFHDQLHRLTEPNAMRLDSLQRSAALFAEKYPQNDRFLLDALVDRLIA